MSRFTPGISICNCFDSSLVGLPALNRHTCVSENYVEVQGKFNGLSTLSRGLMRGRPQPASRGMQMRGRGKRFHRGGVSRAVGAFMRWDETNGEHAVLAPEPIEYGKHVGHGALERARVGISTGWHPCPLPARLAHLRRSLSGERKDKALSAVARSA